MKRIKSYKNIFLTILVFFIVACGYQILSKTIYFQNFVYWSQQNLLLFVVILIILKALGIIIPPIPGGLITFGAIPIIGWKLSYFSDLTGSIIGSSISYYLGKEYGYSLLEKIFDQNTISQIKRIKIIKNKEIESVFVLKTFLGGPIMELICYGAGILRINFTKYLIGSALSHLIVGIPIYYFALNIFESKELFINVLVVILFLIGFYKVKGRYFE